MDTHDESEQEQETSGKGLRAQLEQALNDKKGLETQLSELTAKVRQAEVSKVLSAKGVNAKIAKFIPSDVEGEEAIGKWLEDYADVFGGSTTEAPSDDGQQDNNIPQDVKDSAARIQNLGQQSESPGRFADLESRMAKAETSEELQELWAEAQKAVL